MTTSSIIFGLGLALLTAFLIARPFFQGSVQASSSPGGGERRRLLEHKAAIYAAIREIDTDVLVGKLEVADHRILRQRYVVEGVAVLKALDGLASGDEIDAAIEADVAHRSSGEHPPSDRLFCADCGAQTDPDDKFCAKCGARLRG